MKKIQCPECGRIKEDIDEYCLDCGYVFEINDKTVDIKEENKKEVKKELNKTSMFNFNYVIIFLSIIYLIGLIKIPAIVSRNSGNLSIFEFLKQYTSIHNAYWIFKYGQLIVVGIIILCVILLFINEKTKKFSKVIYLLTFIFEIVFVLIIYAINYKIIIINTILLFIIPLVVFILIKKGKTNNKTENDYVKKIKELKDLYDSEAISKEEFEKYKKNILDKEMK